MIFGSLVLFAPPALLSYYAVEATGIALGRRIIPMPSLAPAKRLGMPVPTQRFDIVRLFLKFEMPGATSPFGHPKDNEIH